MILSKYSTVSPLFSFIAIVDISFLYCIQSCVTTFRAFVRMGVTSTVSSPQYCIGYYLAITETFTNIQ